MPCSRYYFISVLWGLLAFSSISMGLSWGRYQHKPDEWFRSEEGRQTAERILSWQAQTGSWPKNLDTASQMCNEDPETIKGTFDNRATTGEMRFMARAYRATQDTRYLKSFIRGLDHILEAQYPTGGWPQYYPPSKYYHRHITFNDNAMVELMKLLDEIGHSPDYDFVTPQRRSRAIAAYKRGIECIIKCQIRVNGKLTVWCAQHDEIDYSPRPGRSFELVSLSGGESAGILRLLMKQDNPSKEIIEAVLAGVQWYKDSVVQGVRARWKHGNFTVTDDPEAPPLWARFYEIETNRPIFCDRDGIKKYNFFEIDQERSTGYAWYGRWGMGVFGDYEKWRKKWADRLPDDLPDISELIEK